MTTMTTTTPLLSLSSQDARRREVCAQLRGCNPRRDETSIVITELSGKPHRCSMPCARNSPDECKLRAYRDGDDDERDKTRVSVRVNSYVSLLNYETHLSRHPRAVN